MVSPVNLFKSSSLFTNLSQNKKTSAESHIAGPSEGASDTDANAASSPTPSFSAQGDAAARTFSDPNNAQTSPFFLNLNIDSPIAMPSTSVDVAAQRLDGALVERDAAPSAISHYYDGAVNSARENLNTAVTTEIENGDPALSSEERGDVIIGRFEQDSRIRNEVQRTVGKVLAQIETDEQGSEPDRPEFLDTLPDMNGRRALEIVNENFDLVDAADADGEINGTAAKNDLEQIANSDSDEYSEELIAASQYLLDNPEFYGMMEVVREDRKIEVQEGEQSEIDGKFTQEEVQVFLQGQEHMKVILSNTDEIDVSQTGGNPDGLLSENDFNEVTSKKDENGNFVYSRELREAAQFMLDNDRFYDLVDAAAVRGSRPEIGNTSGENNFNSPDGDISSQDLYLSALQMQVFGDDPAAAREFLLNTDQDIIDNFNISDENSIPDEGLRATTAAAMRDVESMDDVIDLVLVLPETNRAFRNELITAVYADLGVEFDDFLGHESGANWAIWGVPASTKVGEVIRNEQVIPFGPLDNGATGKQRTLMAEGNLLLFTDLAPQINNFINTFGDHETFDQAAIDAFKADFPEDQQGLARGFEAYYQARFTDDPKAKQELTLLGNYNLVTHEQALVDPILDEVLTDLPWYADAGNFFTGNEGSERANEAIVVEYPGRSSSVADDVPAHDPDQAAFDNLVVDYDGIDDERIQEFLLRYADDNNANPSNLENTDAKDWHEYSERMYYIYQDWRVHHTDQGIFDMAAESGLSDVNFGSSDS